MYPAPVRDWLVIGFLWLIKWYKKEVWREVAVFVMEHRPLYTHLGVAVVSYCPVYSSRPLALHFYCFSALHI